MLKGIDPRLGPDLLHCLKAMGHGDTLAIVDGNYPATTDARRLIRADGHSSIDMLNAISTLMPIEGATIPASAEVLIPELSKPLADTPIERLEGAEFYAQVQRAFAIVATSDERFHSNLVLTKGALGY